MSTLLLNNHTENGSRESDVRGGVVRGERCPAFGEWGQMSHIPTSPRAAEADDGAADYCTTTTTPPPTHRSSLNYLGD